MPIISTFFGIVIRMYYQNHEPGRFHAEYQENWSKMKAGEQLDRIAPLE